ncbi:Na/Pi cotransporter family protein [Oceaniovalibus sp. ACAM 378]|uniref:Na/Pi cotransporter family protein n=1 Tax=Oceaniovalibus sp. ACAM 378 TaxID=2599923 RepID=UPI0011DA8D81|nr:Na/Pi cotransporter family protein [Oceaniovalibus sp. ACAM 378]TYB91211.1 Na/Pi cotransporter family protein [Oceaniovalibus sp. ACAM 378]
MTILSFIVHLTGATMLLLYAVRMVRTGIERAFGASFRRVMTRSSNVVRASFTGLVLAVILQSSAAVGLLVAGFAGTGALAFGPGLAMTLGADLGSALLIQILSFPLDWLVPLLLAVGGVTFIRSTGRNAKQTGRIILGVAFILISLRFLRETMDPIRDSDFLPAVAGYLAQDYVTAFIVGAVLALVMHSSLAVVLMCVTLVGLQAFPVTAGVSLVLGANLGSAVIPVWLSRSMPPVGRRVPLANLLIRGSWAIIAVVLVNTFAVLPWLTTGGAGQTLVNVHIAFNLMQLAALPLCGLLQAPLARFLPDVTSMDTDTPLIHRSVLDNNPPDSPALALAALKREVMRMSQIVEGMMLPVMDLYTTFDKNRAVALRSEEAAVNRALDSIRHYVTTIPPAEMRRRDHKQARELTEYAIALESAGDIIVKTLLPLAQEKESRNIRFSNAGQDELVAMHERILDNLKLASNVLVSDDLASARLLLEEKAEMAKMERNSRKKHLRRLSDGTVNSFESSDIHLETSRSFREFNSLVASVAYPILYRGGQLLETRLIETLPTGDDAE